MHKAQLEIIRLARIAGTPEIYGSRVLPASPSRRLVSLGSLDRRRRNCYSRELATICAAGIIRSSLRGSLAAGCARGTFEANKIDTDSFETKIFLPANPTMNFPGLPGAGAGGATGGTGAPGFDPNDPNVKWVCHILDLHIYITRRERKQRQRCVVGIFANF